MEPLREDWRQAMIAVEQARDDGDVKLAQRRVRAFHDQLRRTRVLDPACGTGNFLYIALEAMKALEAEVLETLAQLGASEGLGLDSVDPRQFLGLELNERAVPIAELVLWIGYLQLHYKTHSGHPAEPILQAYGTIRRCDAVLAWDGEVPSDAAGAQLPRRPYRPEWPEAEFIVGNPPFIGGKDLRLRLGGAKAEALWAAHPQMNRAADLVMYWWDHAAELLTKENTALRRFGFVTTNSITQPHQRQTLERHLAGSNPVHLAYAIPDQPWNRATVTAAAVRVTMTVAEAGSGTGVRLELVSETALDSDEPDLKFRRTQGRINSDLTIGLDLTRASPLLANRGLCSPGVKLHGAGFIVSLQQANSLGLGRRPGLERYIRPYRNGRDIVQQPRDAWVIDLYPLPADQVRARFPEVYQHLLTTVKPHRDTNPMSFRRENWCWFGATHEMYRSFTAGLGRYVATPETAKHRIFVFLPSEVRADNMLVNFGTSDAFHLGVLSSRPHLLWARATGSVLEDRPRYTKSTCFDPFPFPDPPDGLRRSIEQTAEELDATRTRVQQEHPDLTLTAIYNAIQAPGSLEDFGTMARGRVLILRELHARLDALVLQSYGWALDLTSSDILTRLADLNAVRRREEQAGEVLWLRPGYQVPRFAANRPPLSRQEKRLQPSGAAPERAPLFPRDRSVQPVAVLQMLETLGGPRSVTDLAGKFGGRVRSIDQKIASALVTLARYGRITVLPDGRHLARRAA